MQTSMRFTTALTILACISHYKEERVTSEFVARQIKVNPVTVRSIIGQLRRAGLVKVRRGVGGALFARSPEQITFMDVYRAIDEVLYEEGQLVFRFPEPRTPNCALSRSFQLSLRNRLLQVQRVMVECFSNMTVAELMRDFERCLKSDGLDPFTRASDRT